MREAIENALRSNIATLLKATLFSFFCSLKPYSCAISLSVYVHTISEKFQKTVHNFPRLDLYRPPLILHEKEAFRDTLNSSRKGGFSRPILKLEWIRKRKLSFLVWTGNILKTEIFEKDDITITGPSFQRQIQNDRWLRFYGVVWTEYIWCVLRVKTPFLDLFGVV